MYKIDKTKLVTHAPIKMFHRSILCMIKLIINYH